MAVRYLDATWEKSYATWVFWECIRQMLISTTLVGCMLLGCYLDATWMLLRCYLGFFVTVSDKCSFLVVLMGVCYLGVTLILPGCHLDATWVFCECIRQILMFTNFVAVCYLDAT